MGVPATTSSAPKDPITDSAEDDDETETENPNEDLDHDDLTPPMLDLKRSHRMASMAGSAKDVSNEANLRDISGLREPLYSDLKSSLNRLNNSVHWKKSSTLERKKSSDN